MWHNFLYTMSVILFFGCMWYKVTSQMIMTTSWIEFVLFRHCWFESSGAWWDGMPRRRGDFQLHCFFDKSSPLEHRCWRFYNSDFLFGKFTNMSWGWQSNICSHHVCIFWSSVSRHQQYNFHSDHPQHCYWHVRWVWEPADKFNERYSGFE